MKKSDFIAIIPARYASTRFPGKPLAKLGGKFIIEWVYEQVSLAVDNAIVATDDERIANAVASFGGKSVMTSPNHKSGTDRCYEAYVNNGGNEQVIINVQGDEPFIRPEQIQEIMSCFDDHGTQIATLVKPFDQTRSFAELENPNSPKVVIDKNRHAKYFSRQVIPYLRGIDKAQWPSLHQYYTHLGMYAYTRQTLAEITRLPMSDLEKAESLEQLRWLENGYKIAVGISEFQSIGIDTPEDLEKAQSFLNSANSKC